MTDISGTLDPDQRRAVFMEAGHILVAAAPGSGKTRVLASRLARLVSSGVPPPDILAITFTNRAASEMKSRVAELTGRDASLFNIGTFHAFCLAFLRRTRPPFNLCGREAQLRLLGRLGVRNPDSTLSMISAMKNIAGLSAGPDAIETLALYRKGIEEMNGLDLDDLIPETIKTIESRAASLPSFAHVMVDEYQDINRHQARLLRLLSDSGASLFCIGDPDQAIYAFRGASADSFIDFAALYPGVAEVTLPKNYRSAVRIVNASRAVIQNNASRMKNEISPVRDGGEVIAVECGDEKEEAGFIVSEIERLMGGFTSLSVSRGRVCELRISDFAVLYRTNRQAIELAESFSRSSIPYHVIGPRGQGILDFIEHLKSACPAPALNLDEFIKAEGKAFGLGGGQLAGLIHAASAHGLAAESLRDFLDEMLLADTPEDSGIIADRVSLLTLHAAKGLEFPVVFITGVEDGLLPLRTGDGRQDTEEERRLFYVGMTRAKVMLYLLSCRKRRAWAETLERSPSPFLAEIPKDFISKRVLIEKKETKRRPEQKGLFD